MMHFLKWLKRHKVQVHPLSTWDKLRLIGFPADVIPATAIIYGVTMCRHFTLSNYYYDEVTITANVRLPDDVPGWMLMSITQEDSRFNEFEFVYAKEEIERMSDD